MGIIYTVHFFNTRTKEEKRGHNSWKYQLDNDKLFLVTLQGLLYKEIIVAKTTPGEPMDYYKKKNVISQ